MDATEMEFETKQDLLEGIDKKKELELPDGFPSDELIDKWKAQYGDIRRIRYADKRAFIYRGISRKEHKELRTNIKIIPGTEQIDKEGGVIPNSGELDQDWLDEEIVKLGILYPKLIVNDLKAGEVPILSELIMRISGYIPEGEVERL